MITGEEVEKKLPEIIYHLESFDQDLVRSAIPCYFTSRLASKYVKVILTGEGADELFAGYDYYKDIGCPDRLHSELRRSVTALHNINLQRVDRLTMAHSLEARVPFLDTELIAAAQKIPAKYKLKEDNLGNAVEKWILRKAFEDLLPEEILWRDKEQFDEGSGIVDVVTRGLRSFVSKFNPGNKNPGNEKVEIRSAEEAVYYEIFTKEYSDSDCVLRNVARWSQRD
jgi:asparagine synthase (glutamine-hydrolysing)